MAGVFPPDFQTSMHLKPRLLMLLCLFAYLWASCGMAGLAWASSTGDNEHHQASVAVEADGIALVLSHDAHEHQHVDHDHVADAHVAEAHGHDDHVLKLPNPPDSNAAPVAKDIKHDRLATAPVCVAFDHPLFSAHQLAHVHAQAPPLCRNRAVVQRQSIVLLI